VSGIVDLVVNTEEGVWVIDHKSDAIDDPKAAFEKYRSQLMSYCSTLSSEETRVIGVGINWISRGEVVLERV
jgi:ATP-dependent helicase/nuclease subunit A